MDDIDLANVEIERSKKRALEDNKKLLEDSGIINCIDCDITIPEARKMALPSSKRCYECETLKGEKHV